MCVRDGPASPEHGSAVLVGSGHGSKVKTWFHLFVSVENVGSSSVAFVSGVAVMLYR